MVDTGLMRKNEFKYTSRYLKKNINLILKLINASKVIFKKFKNVLLILKKKKNYW